MLWKKTLCEYVALYKYNLFNLFLDLLSTFNYTNVRNRVRCDNDLPLGLNGKAL